MNTRLNYKKHGPDAVKAMWDVSLFVRQCGLESRLLHLVFLRASQINGCAFCIDIHVEEAIADGENPTRLHLLSVWRETPLFSDREQAALEWTEAVTRITEGGPSDAVYERAMKHFTEEELVNLNLAVVTINGWNRFSIAFHVPPALKSFSGHANP
ncbi:alkylhydroperoxidase AhpD family core domain-containing protein [Terrimicrobium sacchariphilum]|uniref:Alkylhydroperoxidase AhpD family core domain-containing protein n=1 Tax=Terrimicrobium sacchariphilum TaxID=690879 RepID=A0A146G888_TERSA|nr:carboxymuconolactone decarboxylase family protein [Terrimicrobium sacchariphilum]GAT33124.1 alkylhydroperoxidase AhpD family core domain-containing protein [Terrimicrobium sacchariphilum]